MRSFTDYDDFAQKKFSWHRMLHAQSPKQRKKPRLRLTSRPIPRLLPQDSCLGHLLSTFGSPACHSQKIASANAHLPCMALPVLNYSSMPGENAARAPKTTIADSARTSRKPERPARELKHSDKSRNAYAGSRSLVPHSLVCHVQR